MQKDIEELREKCKRIRAEQEISISTIVNETDVPRTTVEAFYGNAGNRHFRYDTVKPLIEHMMKYDTEETEETDQNSNIIEMYSKIIDIKDQNIEYLKGQHDEMRRSRNLFRTLFIVTALAFICLFIIYSFLHGQGWLNNPVQYIPASVAELPA